MNDTTDNITIAEEMMPLGRPRVVPANQNTVCAGCACPIWRGKNVAIYAMAPYALRFWHPACIEADPATLDAKRKATAATQEHLADQWRRLSDLTDARHAEVKRQHKEAFRAVLAWLSLPGMDGLRGYMVQTLQAVPLNPKEKKQKRRKLVRDIAAEQAADEPVTRAIFGFGDEVAS